MARMPPDGLTGTPPDRADAAPDPAPIRPQKPFPLDCCESGCDRCVFEIYADELAHYEAALAAWRARHPGIDPEAG